MLITSWIQLAIVGAGPRGLSVLERICAFVQDQIRDIHVDVHLIDPDPPGAGRVWRTSQPRQLLMNTVASQVTMFTDPTVDLAGPVCPGPSLYEWARFLTLIGPLDDQSYDSRTMTEVATLGPDSYPTRVLYGHYLEWVFRHIRHNAPDSVRIHSHRSRAVALDDITYDDITYAADCVGGPLQSLRLANGEVLADLDAVVLAQGHLATRPTARESHLARFAEAHGLRYVPPTNPADARLDTTRPGERIGLLGLGLNFFDYLALFTEGRGGTFAPADTGGLVYRPSGREPRLYAGSRRGVPFHARGNNQKGAYGRHTPSILTAELVAKMRAAGQVDFRGHVWPLIAKEVETVYYATHLTATHGAPAADEFRLRYLAVPWGSPAETELLDEARIPADRRWSWDRIATPYGARQFRDLDDFRAWLLDHLRQDIAAARAGNVDGPTKAALDVLRDLRNEVRLMVDHGGLTGRSHHDDLEHWYTPLNAYLSIGPPVERIEQAVALLEAGTLVVLGPGTVAEPDPRSGTFTIGSPAVPHSTVHVTTLIDARLPEIDLERSADPLLADLVTRGRCRRYRIPDPTGEPYVTGGLDVTERPYRIVEASGRPHPRRFAFGIPTEAVHWTTAAGVRPGVNSVTLTDADAIAHAALTTGLRSGRPGAGAQRHHVLTQRNAAKGAHDE